MIWTKGQQRQAGTSCVQLTINAGSKMSKSTKKPSPEKIARFNGRKSGEVALTASQQRLLQLLVAGTETEEPTLLAAGRL
ncbi:hypothetical protein ICA15_04400 [Pseudomonas sp. P116]|nr:hypothetical protein [Pseudomonas sp. P9(2020)]MBZ9561383.1 hypothetical protein [Pseudomonas sp. P116]